MIKDMKKVQQAMKQIKAGMQAMSECMDMPMEDGEMAEENPGQEDNVSNETKGMEQMGENMDTKKKMVMSMMKKKMGM